MTGILYHRSMKEKGQILLPFLRRETFFTRRIHIQIGIPFPLTCKNMAGIFHQQYLFAEKREKDTFFDKASGYSIVCASAISADGYKRQTESERKKHAD